MVLNKETLEKIRNIIENHYNHMIINVLGNSIFTEEELLSLEIEGIDVSNDESLLTLIYYNHILNESGATMAPISIEEMRRQQNTRPKGEAHSSAEEHINDNAAHTIRKLRGKTQSLIEGLVRNNNHEYRNNALQNLDRADDIDQLIKESTVGNLKQVLRDATGDIGRDFQRIATTEVSNAIGLGAADRIVMSNKDKDLDAVYVYKIPVEDAALCKYCKRFFIDDDGTPAIYKMSDLLNNGTNYGKKASEWSAVLGAVHPNCFLDQKTLIFTKDGWKQILYVTQDDLILTHTGKFQRVTQTIEYPYGRQLGYEIRYTYNGELTRLRVTPDHKFLTNNGWIEAKSLKLNHKLIKLQKPCEVCDNDIDIKLSTKRVNKICGKSCKSEFSKMCAIKYHSELNTDGKIKRAANCSTGTKNAYASGKLISHFSKDYWTVERRDAQRNNILSRMSQMLKQSAGTRVSKKQKMAYGWLLNEFPEEVVVLEHGVGRYSIDMAFPEYKIGVEIDGIHHTTSRRVKDSVRDASLREQGWTILRFGYKLPLDVTKPNIINAVRNILLNHQELYKFTEIEILEIKQIVTDHKTKLFSISVEEDESLVARGIVSHNCRESGVLELRRGWKVGPGGKVEFIGNEVWDTYIQEKVRK